jgi:signal transduction histidine kinase
MEASHTRVLLVDDEISDALVVKRSLAQEDLPGERFDVAHETTLAQGIARLLRAPVDVLLLDLTLPDSQGPATVAQLRDREPRVPMVVFTGIDDPGVAARAFAAGADDYLVKDEVHAGLLRRTLRNAIARHRAGVRREAAPERDPSDGRRMLLHDLKNLHTSIVGNAQILQREAGEQGFLRQRADSLLGAARAAVDLVHKLSDDGELDEDTGRLVDLSALVRATEPLLHSAVGEAVDLRLDLAARPALVSACPESIRRILLELVVNAGEAIGDAGGRVEVRTGHSLLAAREIVELVATESVAPGPHVWLEVLDDGIGFDAATGARLLERGFSTKGAGRGRGLDCVRESLARHRAGLRVRSRPGGGSEFRVLMPAAG